jgi:hypothetical protein
MSHGFSAKTFHGDLHMNLLQWVVLCNDVIKMKFDMFHTHALRNILTYVLKPTNTSAFVDFIT